MNEYANGWRRTGHGIRGSARILLLLLAVAWVASCRATDTGPSEAIGTDALISSFNVGVLGDSVSFTLVVSNGGEDPVVLDFATAQRFDFEVLSSAGAEVWRWSAERAFTQALEADTLGPMEQREWVAWWRPGDLVGEHVAVARLMAMGRELRLETGFDLSDR